MKKVIIVIVLLVIIGVAYAERHQLKSMFGMTPSAPQAPTQTAQSKAPASSSAMAPSDNIYLTKTDPSKGKYLTDFHGMTLYTFDKDTKGSKQLYW